MWVSQSSSITLSSRWDRRKFWADKWRNDLPNIPPFVEENDDDDDRHGRGPKKLRLGPQNKHRSISSRKTSPHRHKTTLKKENPNWYLRRNTSYTLDTRRQTHAPVNRRLSTTYPTKKQIPCWNLQEYNRIKENMKERTGEQLRNNSQTYRPTLKAFKKLR